MSKYFSRVATAARRAMRLDKFADLKNAFGGHEAKMRLTSQNVGQAAISMVREILDQYSLPNRPNLGYSGIRAARLASNNKIDGGVITVHAEFRTRTGVNVGIDVPVEVREGQLIEPSVVVVNGSPRIIAQSTFDDIVSHNTFKEQARIRPIYSAPLTSEQNAAELEHRREQTRVNKGLFSASKNREVLRNIVAGKAAQYVEHDYESFDPARNVDPEDFLQPAEQEDGLQPGDTTSLSEAVEVRNRGGGVEEYSSGSKVTIVRDMAGDGTVYVVEFDDGLQAIVESGLLKKAQQDATPATRACLNCNKTIFTPFTPGSGAPNWQGHFCSEACRNQYIGGDTAVPVK